MYFPGGGSNDRRFSANQPGRSPRFAPSFPSPTRTVPAQNSYVGAEAPPLRYPIGSPTRVYPGVPPAVSTIQRIPGPSVITPMMEHFDGRREDHVRKRPSMLNDFQALSDVGLLRARGDSTDSGSFQRLEPKKEAPYIPQVENISPTPDDQPPPPPTPSVTNADKERILDQIRKVDQEIAAVESQVKKLKLQQKELEEPKVPETDASSHMMEVEDNNNNGPQGMCAQILAENQKKAAATHAKLTNWSGFVPTVPGVPLYQEPWDIPQLVELRKKFETFKPLLVQHLKNIHNAEAAREKCLTERYNQLIDSWKKKADKFENSQKRKAREAKNRELFEKVFPELKKQREEKERLSRMETRSGVGVTSRGLEEKAVAQAEQEEEDFRAKQSAVVAPLLCTSQLRNRYYFIDRSGIVKDPMAKHEAMLTQFQWFWSAEEKQKFRQYFAQYGKNFAAIAVHLPKKSTKDCIQYYYLTKKRENFKQLLRRHYRRRGKPYKPPVMPRFGEQPAKQAGEADVNMEEQKEAEFFCVVCKQLIDASNPGRVLTRGCYEQYGLDQRDMSLNDVRICQKCRLVLVRKRYSQCPVGRCSTAKRRVKPTRPMPTKWAELSVDQRALITAELQISSPEDSAFKCCNACFKRIGRRIEVELSGGEDVLFADQKRFASLNVALEWSSDELNLLVEGIAKHGTDDWDKIAESLSLRSAIDCERCYTQRQEQLAAEVVKLGLGPVKPVLAVQGIEDEQEEEDPEAGSGTESVSVANNNGHEGPETDQGQPLMAVDQHGANMKQPMANELGLKQPITASEGNMGPVVVLKRIALPAGNNTLVAAEGSDWSEDAEDLKPLFIETEGEVEESVQISVVEVPKPKQNIQQNSAQEKTSSNQQLAVDLVDIDDNSSNATLSADEDDDDTAPPTEFMSAKSTERAMLASRPRGSLVLEQLPKPVIPEPVLDPLLAASLIPVSLSKAVKPDPEPLKVAASLKLPTTGSPSQQPTVPSAVSMSIASSAKFEMGQALGAKMEMSQVGSQQQSPQHYRKLKADIAHRVELEQQQQQKSNVFYPQQVYSESTKPVFHIKSEPLTISIPAQAAGAAKSSPAQKLPSPVKSEPQQTKGSPKTTPNQSRPAAAELAPLPIPTAYLPSDEAKPIKVEEQQPIRSQESHQPRFEQPMRFEDRKPTGMEQPIRIIEEHKAPPRFEEQPTRMVEELKKAQPCLASPKSQPTLCVKLEPQSSLPPHSAPSAPPTMPHPVITEQPRPQHAVESTLRFMHSTGSISQGTPIRAPPPPAPPDKPPPASIAAPPVSRFSYSLEEQGRLAKSREELAVAGAVLESLRNQHVRIAATEPSALQQIERERQALITGLFNQEFLKLRQSGFSDEQALQVAQQRVEQYAVYSMTASTAPSSVEPSTTLAAAAALAGQAMSSGPGSQKQLTSDYLMAQQLQQQQAAAASMAQQQSAAAASIAQQYRDLLLHQHLQQQQQAAAAQQQQKQQQLQLQLALEQQRILEQQQQRPAQQQQRSLAAYEKQLMQEEQMRQLTAQYQHLLDQQQRALAGSPLWHSAYAQQLMAKAAASEMLPKPECLSPSPLQGSSRSPALGLGGVASQSQLTAIERQLLVANQRAAYLGPSVSAIGQTPKERCMRSSPVIVGPSPCSTPRGGQSDPSQTSQTPPAQAFLRTKGAMKVLPPTMHDRSPSFSPLPLGAAQQAAILQQFDPQFLARSLFPLSEPPSRTPPGMMPQSAAAGDQGGQGQRGRANTFGSTQQPSGLQNRPAERGRYGESTVNMLGKNIAVRSAYPQSSAAAAAVTEKPPQDNRSPLQPPSSHFGGELKSRQQATQQPQQHKTPPFTASAASDSLFRQQQRFLDQLERSNNSGSNTSRDPANFIESLISSQLNEAERRRGKPVPVLKPVAEPQRPPQPPPTHHAFLGPAMSVPCIQTLRGKTPDNQSNISGGSVQLGAAKATSGQQQDSKPKPQFVYDVEPISPPDGESLQQAASMPTLAGGVDRILAPQSQWGINPMARLPTPMSYGTQMPMDPRYPIPSAVSVLYVGDPSRNNPEAQASRPSTSATTISGAEFPGNNEHEVAAAMFNLLPPQRRPQQPEPKRTAPANLAPPGPVYEPLSDEES